MGITMPWINLTLRRGALSKPVQHAMMTKLTEVLMWWEKVPDTLAAGKFMKGWVYEVAEEADYNAGSPNHDKPFYFLEIRIPINRPTSQDESVALELGFFIGCSSFLLG
jgi:hypothetical protein